MKINSARSTAAIAGLIAIAGMLSACSSSDTASSASTESATVAQGDSAAGIPADVSQAFFVAYCAKNKGTLNEATGECTSPDGSTAKIDVTQTDPAAAAIVVSLAYENPTQADIAGCPTAAEIKAAASGDTPPAITLDCQIAAIQAMTAALSQ